MMNKTKTDVTTSAGIQLMYWLDRVQRSALGVLHERTPVVRRGQWVRFVGNPSSVRMPHRQPPRCGAYGQVAGLLGRGALIVVFVGTRCYAQVRAADVEPLVGTPVGCPRDHLRRFRRCTEAHRRAEERAESRYWASLGLKR